MDYYKNLSLDNIVEEIDGIVYVEEWIDIRGWEDRYQISSFGRCKSKARFHVSYRGKDGVAWNKAKILKQNENGNGYLGVLLYRNDFCKVRMLIQRLVAIHFIPNFDNKPTVNHIYSNKKNNFYKGLEWASQSEQQNHAVKNGLRNNTLGESSNFSKLKTSEVVDIRKMFDSGKFLYKDIAIRFNISETVVGSIGNRKSWKHI